MRKGKKKKYLCSDGPMNRQYLFLSSPQTLPFKLYDQIGYYGIVDYSRCLGNTPVLNWIPKSEWSK